MRVPGVAGFLLHTVTVISHVTMSNHTYIQLSFMDTALSPEHFRTPNEVSLYKGHRVRAGLYGDHAHFEHDQIGSDRTHGRNPLSARPVRAGHDVTVSLQFLIAVFDQGCIVYMFLSSLYQYRWDGNPHKALPALWVVA